MCVLPLLINVTRGQVFYVTVQQGGGNSWTVYRRFDGFQRLGNQVRLLALYCAWRQRN